MGHRHDHGGLTTTVITVSRWLRLGVPTVFTDIQILSCLPSEEGQLPTASLTEEHDQANTISGATQDERRQNPNSRISMLLRCLIHATAGFVDILPDLWPV